MDAMGDGVAPICKLQLLSPPFCDASFPLAKGCHQAGALGTHRRALKAVRRG